MSPFIFYPFARGACSHETFDTIYASNELGKKNKVAKLTERRIRYLIRAKTRGASSKRVAKASRSNHPLMGGERTLARFYQVALTRGHWRTAMAQKYFCL
jgi:hypothetical protein